MERKLIVEIAPERGSVAEICITDTYTGYQKCFYVGGYNTTDDKAMEIGYEIINLAELEIERLMSE